MVPPIITVITAIRADKYHFFIFNSVTNRIEIEEIPRIGGVAKARYSQSIRLL